MAPAAHSRVASLMESQSWSRPGHYIEIKVKAKAELGSACWLSSNQQVFTFIALFLFLLHHHLKTKSSQFVSFFNMPNGFDPPTDWFLSAECYCHLWKMSDGLGQPPPLPGKLPLNLSLYVAAVL